MIKMQGYSTWWRDRQVRRYARRHTKRGVEACADLVTVKLIGARPSREAHPEYERLTREATHDERKAEWQQQLEAVEKELAQHVRPWVFRFGIFGLWIVEFLAATELLLNEGFVPPTVYIVAAATACILSYLMYTAAKEMK